MASAVADRLNTWVLLASTLDGVVHMFLTIVPCQVCSPVQASFLTRHCTCALAGAGLSACVLNVAGSSPIFLLLGQQAAIPDAGEVLCTAVALHFVILMYCRGPVGSHSGLCALAQQLCIALIQLS
jgi:hypothetical protein